jgi:hypothetical protein
MPTASTTSLFEGLASLKSVRLYRLALVDEQGKPLSYPSEDELARLWNGNSSQKPARASASPRASSPKRQQHAAEQPKEPSFQALLAEAVHKSGGPVCSHCGAT